MDGDAPYGAEIDGMELSRMPCSGKGYISVGYVGGDSPCMLSLVADGGGFILMTPDEMRMLSKTLRTNADRVEELTETEGWS